MVRNWQECAFAANRLLPRNATDEAREIQRRNREYMMRKFGTTTVAFPSVRQWWVSDESVAIAAK